MKMTALALMCVFSAAALAKEPPFDKAAMNLEANPCDDFYEFACGVWVEKTQIPADRPSWTHGFDDINLRNQQLLKGILTDYSKGHYKPDVPYAKQIGEIFGSCMNEKAVEETARKEFAEAIAPITKLDSNTKIAALVADLHLKRVDILFDFSASPDLKNSDLMVGDTDQGGMGLPTKDYYLKDTPDMKRMQVAYKTLITSALKIAGYAEGDAIAKADAVFALETRLAKASMSPEEHRDASKLFHRVERKGLMKLTPKFDWPTYLTALGQPKLDQINVEVPDFFSALDKTISETPVDVMKAYFIARMFRTYASTMDKEAVNANFQYLQAAMGMKELPPRWKRCVDATGVLMGMAVGHAYVDKAFAGDSKKVATEMMRNIEKAMKATLSTLPWMDDTTRAAAIDKLAGADDAMGYPDKWRNYDSLTTSKTSYMKNAMAGYVFKAKYELDKIGKPVDRGEWHMDPYVVNAYNNPQWNQMRFPAGILQPPNFDVNRILAANYGGIGAVMGHELTHGYDDQGRKFNKKGDMQDWWSKPTATEFERRAKCLSDQYSSYKVDEELHINGQLTLGETIADQGGLKLAVAAWKESERNPSSDKVNGFTHLQALFIAYAQVWCSKDTPQYRKYITNSNPHPLPKFRVLGTLSDNAEFAEAFNCKAGDKMVAQPQCVVW